MSDRHPDKFSGMVPHICAGRHKAEQPMHAAAGANIPLFTVKRNFGGPHFPSAYAHEGRNKQTQKSTVAFLRCAR